VAFHQEKKMLMYAGEGDPMFPRERVVVARIVIPSPIFRTMLQELAERVGGGPKRSGEALRLVKASGSA
jgi:hypothetical protein